MKINWNFMGGGGCKTKHLLWGEYGYFLELHNHKCMQLSILFVWDQRAKKMS